MSIATGLLLRGVALALGALVALLGLGVLLLYGLARRQEHFGAAARRAALGVAATSFDPADEAVRPIALDGVLRLDGKPTERPDDGAPAAVVTLAVTGRAFWFTEPKVPDDSSFRAERLILQVGEQRIALEGPIRLAVGSRQWWPGRQLRRVRGALWQRMPAQQVQDHGWDTLGGRLGVFRSVADGDRVLVRGELHKLRDESGSHGASYRRGAVRFALRPRAGETELELAALRAPKFAAPLHRLLGVPAVLGSALAVMLLAVGGTVLVVYAQLACESGYPCAYEGRCSITLSDQNKLTCGPRRAFDCQRSDSCRFSGLCTLRGDACVAASDEDCRLSSMCVQSGACTSIDLACTPGSDADCEQSLACQAEGYCRRELTTCVRGGPTSCLKQRACLDDGACTWTGKKCAVSSSLDCTRSRACTEEGRCMFDPAAPPERACVANDDATCAHARFCALRGQCTARNGQCIAASIDGCRQSENCQKHGMCELRDERCVGKANEDVCRRTDECASDGFCSPDGNHCVAASDQDCQASRGCASDGRCSASGGRCIARSDGECGMSDGCKMSGRCVVTASGRCDTMRGE
jgi:hypothetical protein